MIRTILIGASLATAAMASADSYFFGVGINDYDTPMDAYGQPMKDEEGNVADPDLFGCLNDVRFYSKFIGERSRVPAKNSIVLLDDDANAENIVKKLRSMLSRLKSGDKFYFAFSGHSTQFDGGKEPDGKEEYIVTKDLVLISDDVFRDLAATLRTAGIDCTFVFDSCYAGGLAMDTPAYQKVTGKAFPFELGKSSRFAQTTRADQLVTVKKPRGGSATSLFFFACRENEKSADLKLHDGSGHGAFSMFLERVLKAEPAMTVESALNKVNTLLGQAGFSQRSTVNTSSPERKRRPIAN